MTWPMGAERLAYWRAFVEGRSEADGPVQVDLRVVADLIARVDALQAKLDAADGKQEAAPVAASWKPTHRHYMGGFYRLTGWRLWTGNDDNDGAGVVLYDDQDGGEYAMLARRWESLIGEPIAGRMWQTTTPVRRYAPLE